jgi:hypothetical protein
MGVDILNSLPVEVWDLGEVVRKCRQEWDSLRVNHLVPFIQEQTHPQVAFHRETLPGLLPSSLPDSLLNTGVTIQLRRRSLVPPKLKSSLDSISLHQLTLDLSRKAASNINSLRDTITKTEGKDNGGNSRTDNSTDTGHS